ncbi:MAG: hypothetical protein AA908_07300 [Chlorobi bacterium NICIL-2]|nr:MAG: hypothetical protein AA908_07300 [Chlorobi bacterium NICIL-2]
MTRFLVALWLGTASFLWAQTQPAIELRNGWMYSADSGMVTGAFLEIHNRTNQPDTILFAQSDCAEHTEIHTTIRNSDGTMGMRPLSELVVPAQKTVVLKPRSLHVMLYHLRRTLRAGDRCRLVLKSKRYGDLPIELDVRR